MLINLTDLINRNNDEINSDNIVCDMIKTLSMHRADKYSQDNPGAISNHEKLCSMKVKFCTICTV